jgi:hypothetical protein
LSGAARVHSPSLSRKPRHSVRRASKSQ